MEIAGEVRLSAGQTANEEEAVRCVEEGRSFLEERTRASACGKVLGPNVFSMVAGSFLYYTVLSHSIFPVK
jgi:hypothetical protein